MEAPRARAYRYLLYWATLEIRGISWFAWRRRERWNPFYLMRSIALIRSRGALADWLHNLAQFSAHDFTAFDETWFWQEYDVMKRKHGRYWRADYRKIFDDELGVKPPPL